MYKTKEDVERVISLSKPQNVIDMFVESYLQGVEYEAWIETKKAEHETLYPKFIDATPVYDTDGVTILHYTYTDGINNVIQDFPQRLNPDYIDFDTYISETEQVQVGTRDVLGEDGITVIGTEPIYEDRLVRQYEEIVVDVEAWKATSELYKKYLDAIKDETLNNLKVTISTGKQFYGDPASRSDLADAILLSNINGITETTWKLASEFEGSRYAVVTVAELSEALHIALQTKGQIVGAIQ